MIEVLKDLVFIFSILIIHFIGFFIIGRIGFVPKSTRQNKNTLMERPIYNFVFCIYVNLFMIFAYLFIDALYEPEIASFVYVVKFTFIFLFILFTSYIILEVINYKVIFDKYSIQVNTFYGRKRKFTWEDIRAIKFSSMLNSIVIYYGKNNKTVIYINTFNIANFVKVMKEQVSEEQYNNIIKSMNQFYKMWFINPSRILHVE